MSPLKYLSNYILIILFIPVSPNCIKIIPSTLDALIKHVE